MRRLLLLLVPLLALTAGAPIAAAEQPPDPSSGLEELVTCGQGKEMQAAVSALVQNHGFEVDPENSNFYVPTGHLTAFDLELRYVGLAGVMMQPGPNLTVVATVEALKDRVQQVTGYSFECGEPGCWHRLSSNEAIIIYPYETDPRLVTVQCGYYGG